MEDRKIKCVVWDLDQTIWNGILTEDQDVECKEDVKKIIKELDARGILQSISSKNEMAIAKQKLEEFGLWEYFIYPQINWNPKSSSIEEIRNRINIGIDTIAFIDDQIFELDEVKFAHPEVLCISAEQIEDMLSMDCLQPRFITKDSKCRRKMYQNDIVRNEAEKKFEGSKEEFLRTLEMEFEISKAKEEDLQRAEELTIRTHQLNSTGYVYSYDELKGFLDSKNHVVLMAELKDKYGDYGKIGLALIEKAEEIWELKLLLMSCRVMSKGVGGVWLNYIQNQALDNKVKLRARFVPSDRNRIMYITYKFNEFIEIDKMQNNTIVLQSNIKEKRIIPDYIKVTMRE